MNSGLYSAIHPSISACSGERRTMSNSSPPLPVLSFWTAENSPMLIGPRSPLIVDIQVLRGRPLGRFHSFRGASAAASAILVSTVGGRCEMWPKRESLWAFNVVLARGCWVLCRAFILVTKSCQRRPRIFLRHWLSKVSSRSESAGHGPGLASVQQTSNH